MLALGLLGAALLGGAIGIQRQVTGKVAGFRTHMLVALGSCVFMEISRIIGDSRIAAGVITGIGFLGAGAIVREGIVPRGLTTAASIWCAAAVGLVMGYGGQEAHALAFLATLFVLFALALSDSVLQRVTNHHESIEVDVTFDPDAIEPEALGALLRRDDVHVRKSTKLSVRHDGAGRVATWTLTLRSKHQSRLRAVVLELSKHPAVSDVRAEGAPNV